MQSTTAVKQRLARQVSKNPLRMGQPADRMMDDDHSMKDEAAEVEDIEDQEEQHGVEREELTLEDWFGSFAEEEPRVHDGGLGQEVVPVEAEPAHGSLDTDEGAVPRGCANLSWSARERDEHLPYRDSCDVCVRARGRKAGHRQRSQGEKEEQDQVPRVAMDFFYVNEKDRAEIANFLFIMIDEDR